MLQSKRTKQAIPKVLKDLSWSTWIGDTIAKHPCLCCKQNEIKMNSFHCGHIIAESKGGAMNRYNLIPICSSCNLSMGSQNMREFQKRCGFDAPTGGPPLPGHVTAHQIFQYLMNQTSTNQLSNSFVGQQNAGNATITSQPSVPIAESVTRSVPTSRDRPSTAILLIQRKLKVCPGREIHTEGAQTIFRCAKESGWEHCSRCRNHYQLSIYSACPCS